MILLGGLWVLAILADFVWAAWLLLRHSRGWNAGWRALLLLAVLLAPLQFASDYSLATPFGPFAIYGVACLAYIVMMMVVWRRSRVAAGLGLALPGAPLLVGAHGILLAVAVGLGARGIRPVAEGRISPTVSYRIVLSHGLFGATPYYEYKIYRNPRWFPLIQKKVTNSALPCGWQSEPKDDVIGPGRDETQVEIRCTDPQRGGPFEIPVR